MLVATLSVSTVSSSGSNAIDALLYGTCWSTGSISFSFPVDGSTFVSDYSDSQEYERGFEALSATMQDGIRQALSLWASVANLTFTEVDEPSGGGVIRVAQSSEPSTAYSYLPTAAERGGDIWFGYHYNYTNPQWQTYSNYAFLTMLHEIGHALGLKHPGDYGDGDEAPFLDTAHDAVQYTVMSYRSYPGDTAGGYILGSSSYPQTPMLYDIQAIQYLYGANYDYNADDTTYSFSPTDTKIFRTVWDGGGTDTYDASAYACAVEIELTPGSWSILASSQLADLGNGVKAPGSVANAFLYQDDARSLIENAVGGSGDDILRGNAGDNVLTGGAGCDQIWGGSGGNDTLVGGLGDDVYWWGTGGGNDTVMGDAYMQLDVLRLSDVTMGTHQTSNQDGNLHIQLDDGSTLDILGWYPQDATTRLQCFVFADNVAYAWNNGQGASVNLFDAAYQNNVHVAIGGDAEPYCLRGTSAADTLTGGAADDQIWGGDGGNDVLSGRSGSDTYWFTADGGVDTIVAAADNSVDRVWLNTTWQPSDLTPSLTGADLHLTAGATEIVLAGWGNGGGYQLNSFYFAQTGGTYMVAGYDSGTLQWAQIS
ncbi:MAG: matrixin family metalloprotease [Veillonellaceae bacterium]|nr:matrixin family metalloprotease [Veillonellaceae bacterium]